MSSGHLPLLGRRCTRPPLCRRLQTRHERVPHSLTCFHRGGKGVLQKLKSAALAPE